MKRAVRIITAALLGASAYGASPAFAAADEAKPAVAAPAVAPADHADAKPIGPKPVEERDVLSGKVTRDPTRGYIFISGPARQFGMFLRLPDDESRAAWEKDRQKAFAKAQKSYQSALTQWKADVAVANQTKAKPPEPPVEPKLETFVADPLELRDQVMFGPMNVYAKGETVSYLEAVKPGTYIWYGPVLGGPGLPSGGVCMCMGSVKFAVKAGAVTSLGNALAVLPHWDEDSDVARLTAKEQAAKRAAAGKEPAKTLALGALRYDVPASLKDWPQEQAELHASPKMNNYLGILISRLAPIPGVLAYHRDVVVDARTGEELSNPTLVSRAKIKK
ncbi:hypothetical protein [Novosphingobium sp. FKTRR1]|uniref:hypothetical protein n=1 Tax=Novosphingobium sp. FKTRR1 TaxID=2879118 RepID=UPI001CEFE0C6|nr:hypothetical protein [Novosphingobium sp. FKTRR1]